MHSYRFFGLQINSEVCLSGVYPDATRADVVITRGDIRLPPMRRGLFGVEFSVQQDTVFLKWEQIGSFRMQGGREVTVDVFPEIEDAVLQAFITGPVLGAILYQRGCLVLHASAVALDGRAIAFIGESGWGKSTLAAHLLASGGQLITDDIVAVQVGDEAHRVFPGVPEIRLLPDAVTAIGKNPEDLPTDMPGSVKRVCAVDGVTQPLPLARIYLLDSGHQHEISPLASSQTAIELVRHTYGVSVLRSIDPTRHFQHCMTLARTVVIRRLRRHLSLDRLPELIELIKDDLAYDH
ncbi:MAG: serine kinase [Armatimonadota bacterium]